jgi:hypothetical protein
VILEKKSGKCVVAIRDANGSFVWASDSKALAFPRWTRGLMPQLVVLSVPGGATQVVGDEYRVLELISFDEGVVEGIDSRIYRPAGVAVKIA